MNQFFTYFQSLLIFASIYLVSCFVFVFVFINSTQLLLATNVPYAKALKPFDYDFVVDNLIKDFSQFEVDEMSLKKQQYVRPEFMRLPRNEIELAIDQEYFIEGKRWIRPASAHFTHLNFDSDGIPGDTLIYMKQSWQTIPNIGILTNGTTISIESIKGGSMDYQIVETVTLNKDDRYVAEGDTNRQLILLIVQKDGDYTVSRAVSGTAKNNTELL